MLIRFLHISDAHIRPGARSAHDLRRLHKALITTLRDVVKKQGPLDLVLFSGDLAFDGTRYDVCRVFLEEIITASGITAKYGSTAREHLFIVPGNHDVDRSKTRYLLRTLEGRDDAIEFFGPGATSAREPHFRRMKAFASFYNDFYGGARSLSASMPCYVESLTFSEGKDEESIFRLAGLNSVWFSQGDDDHNKLWIGEPHWFAAMEQLVADPVPTFTVVMQHHPCEWLHPQDGHSLEAAISRHADIFLFGHVHAPLYQGSFNQYGQCIRLQAGAMHDPDLPQQRALLGTLDSRARTLHLRPIAYFGAAQDKWVTDPTVFADDADHTRTVHLPARDPGARTTDSAMAVATSTDRLDRFYRKLSESIASLRVDHFIELHLSIRSAVSIRTLSARTERSDDKIEVDRLLEVYDGRPIALLGDPGGARPR